jgi:hypothetical protein
MLGDGYVAARRKEAAGTWRNAEMQRRRHEGYRAVDMEEWRGRYGELKRRNPRRRKRR